MSGTSCPNCDAPAPAGARRCGRCGYDFLETGEETRRRVPRGALGVIAALVLLAATAAILLARGGAEGQPSTDRAGLSTFRRLEVLSDRPLATRAAERRLEARFTAMRDDDSAAVRCSEREPKPAHSLRRCRVRYPSGIERVVVLLTNARGAEVISEP